MHLIMATVTLESRYIGIVGYCFLFAVIQEIAETSLPLNC